MNDDLHDGYRYNGEAKTKDTDNPSSKEIADALRGLDPQPNTLVRSFEVEFERLRCIVCDMSFYVPKYWREQRVISAAGFYCPNGHSMYYPKAKNDESS